MHPKEAYSNLCLSSLSVCLSVCLPVSLSLSLAERLLRHAKFIYAKHEINSVFSLTWLHSKTEFECEASEEHILESVGPRHEGVVDGQDGHPQQHPHHPTHVPGEVAGVVDVVLGPVGHLGLQRLQHQVHGGVRRLPGVPLYLEGGLQRHLVDGAAAGGQAVDLPGKLWAKEKDLSPRRLDICQLNSSHLRLSSPRELVHDVRHEVEVLLLAGLLPRPEAGRSHAEQVLQRASVNQ